MKKVLLSSAACLSMLAASAWLVATPALAGSITMSCYGGGSVSCSGNNCSGADGTAETRGWCQCTSSNGDSTSQTCPNRGGGGIAPEEPVYN